MPGRVMTRSQKKQIDNQVEEVNWVQGKEGMRVHRQEGVQCEKTQSNQKAGMMTRTTGKKTVRVTQWPSINIIFAIIVAMMIGWWVCGSAASNNSKGLVGLDTFEAGVFCNSRVTQTTYFAKRELPTLLLSLHAAFSRHLAHTLSLSSTDRPHSCATAETMAYVTKTKLAVLDDNTAKQFQQYGLMELYRPCKSRYKRTSQRRQWTTSTSTLNRPSSRI